MKKILFGPTGFLMCIVLLMCTGLAFAKEAAVAVAVVPAATAVADPVNIAAFFHKYWIVISTVITIASIVANSTPNDSDNKVVAMLDKIFGVFAMNFNVKGVSVPPAPTDKAKG